MKNSMRLLRKNKIQYVYVASALFLLVAVLFAVLCGSTDVSITELFRVLCGESDTPSARIFLYVRFPRALASVLCGAALAVSGAVLQGVLANRLASPSVIGVNAGAGLAVTLCAAFGVVGGFALSFSAFLGALLAVTVVSLCAQRWGASRGTLILMGVALNSFLGAIVDAVIAFQPDLALLNYDFKVGDFSSVTYDRVFPAACIVLLSLIFLFTLTGELDVLTLGDENAAGLGMNVKRMRLSFLVLAAFLAGAAVSIAGLLSFVGLLVPHAVRRIGGARAKHLLPLSALVGGGFVCLSDTLSRVLFAPYELPVGILMAFLGAPFFFFILLAKRGGHGDA